jgi:hypothetical protein
MRRLTCGERAFGTDAGPRWDTIVAREPVMTDRHLACRNWLSELMMQVFKLEKRAVKCLARVVNMSLPHERLIRSGSTP